MKKWNEAEIVELNIAETANGRRNGHVELSYGKYGWNNDMFDGEDSNGDGIFRGSNNQNQDDDTQESETTNPLS